MPLNLGTRLGSYEISGSLGAGGMGEVYRARDTRLGREVAIKVLPDLFAADPERVARLEREAQAVAALSHPNILAIHDYGIEGTRAYAVMELLDGETLRDQLADGALRTTRTRGRHPTRGRERRRRRPRLRVRLLEALLEAVSGYPRPALGHVGRCAARRRAGLRR